MTEAKTGPKQKYLPRKEENCAKTKKTKSMPQRSWSGSEACKCSQNAFHSGICQCQRQRSNAECWYLYLCIKGSMCKCVWHNGFIVLRATFGASYKLTREFDRNPLNFSGNSAKTINSPHKTTTRIHTHIYCTYIYIFICVCASYLSSNIFLLACVT